MTTYFRTLMLAGAAIATLATVSTANAADLRAPAQQPSGITLVANKPDMNGPEKFIASMGDRGINFLGNQSMSMDAKSAEFSKLLNDSFDMNTIGRFALGNAWRTATPAQQQEYLTLFKKMVVKVYSKRFSDYKGQKFEVRSSHADNDKDTTVTSAIVPTDGPEVRVDWRVRSKDGGYKIVDIIVEGVSMVMTQRADFASVIQQGGGNIEALLQHLRQQ